MSVRSASVVGVWVGVGSSATQSHSVCVVCDPVVTYKVLRLNFVAI